MASMGAVMPSAIVCSHRNRNTGRHRLAVVWLCTVCRASRRPLRRGDGQASRDQGLVISPPPHHQPNPQCPSDLIHTSHCLDMPREYLASCPLRVPSHAPRGMTRVGDSGVRRVGRRIFFFVLSGIDWYHAVALTERSPNPLLNSDLSNSLAQNSDFRFSR